MRHIGGEQRTGARRSGPALVLAWASACGGTSHEVEANGLAEDASAARADARSDSAAEAGFGDAHDDAGGDAAGPSDANSAALDATILEPDAAEAGTDASVRADARIADAAPRPCAYSYQPAWQVCEAAQRIDSGATLSAQDTATGARGDCAVHASGSGGRNLYYRLKLPAGRDTRVIAVPSNPSEVTLVRALTSCRDAEAERGARGLTGGRAELCLHNDGASERELILAVGRYSGESLDLTVVFDLTVEPLAAGQSCGW